MKYFKNANGEVFAYETQEDRERFGTSDLVQMTDAEVTAFLVPAVQEPQVPASVTMRQARLALHFAGQLSAVETAIDALPEPPKTASRIEWDYASTVHRSSQFVAQMGAALELDEQGLDELFFAAAEL